ncbi:MAG TPA: energy transducer TonB, partial [Stellaceae bacterium]|nr:energy transducer TonB [Stellaceae bacterium]
TLVFEEPAALPTPAPPPAPAPEPPSAVAETPPEPAVTEPAPEPPPPVAVAEPARQPLPKPPPRKPAPPRHHAAAPRIATLAPSQPAPSAPAQVATTATAPALPAAPILPPQPISGFAGNRKPDYPNAAKLRGQQGRVVLRVDVSAAGLPLKVAVLTTSGYTLLDKAALAAIEQWRFHPATQAGTPVAGTADVPIQFRLEE